MLLIVHKPDVNALLPFLSALARDVDEVVKLFLVVLGFGEEAASALLCR